MTDEVYRPELASEPRRPVGVPLALLALAAVTIGSAPLVATYRAYVLATLTLTLVFWLLAWQSLGASRRPKAG